MEIQIQNAEDKNNIKEEKIIFKVFENLNIGHYLVVDTDFNGSGNLEDIGRYTFRFSAKQVKAGDYIILYTKERPLAWLNKKIIEGTKSTIHFFYWNRTTPIWNKGITNCTILRIVDF